MMVALGTLCAARELTDKNWDSRISEILGAFLKNAPLPFSLLEQLSRLRWVRKVLESAMSFVIPGMFSHYAARKMYIENYVRAEIAKGCKQLVVIGGGLDTLTFRVKEDFPEVYCIEIDHPSTHSLKTQAVNVAGRKLPEVGLVAADLSCQKVSEVLKQSNHQAENTTVFVVEGVLMYLTESNVRSTLSDLRSLCTADSSLIITCMITEESGQPAFANSKNHFVTRWLKGNHEPFLWGLDKDNVKNFFNSIQFEVEKFSEKAELQLLTSALPSWFKAPAEGEFVVSLRKSL